MNSWKDLGTTSITVLITATICILILFVLIINFLPMGKTSYFRNIESLASTTPKVTAFKVTHIDTPKAVKAVYLSSWAAGNDKFRDHLYDLVKTTEINSVVIDIKDYSGIISFEIDNPKLSALAVTEKRIPDIKEFIAKLHSMNVYVIGRVSSFQDSSLIKAHPEWAVKTPSGTVWKDYKGVSWLDAGATPVWDYLVDIGKYSHEIGFDEINFDYIRFPSDGDLKNIKYSWSEDKVKADVIKNFFVYIHEQFKESGITISADLFGLTTTASGDLGIGQVLETALPYFDYVAPMVYPSHFGYGFNNIARPAEHPYEVIKFSMGRASERALSASTTPSKLRPWLQAFDLGATYGPDKVRAQIQATYDVGLDSWMLWNAASVYNKSALKPKTLDI